MVDAGRDRQFFNRGAKAAVSPENVLTLPGSLQERNMAGLGGIRLVAPGIACRAAQASTDSVPSFYI